MMKMDNSFVWGMNFDLAEVAFKLLSRKKDKSNIWLNIFGQLQHSHTGNSDKAKTN